MNNEDTIIDNPSVKKNPTEETITQTEQGNQAPKSNKKKTIAKAVSGFGMGILLGSVSTVLKADTLPQDSSAQPVDDQEAEDIVVVETTPEIAEDTSAQIAAEDNTNATITSTVYHNENQVGAVPMASNVSDEMSFSEAFAAARAETGPGGVFVWRGNVYNTYYEEEWDSMSDADKQDYADHLPWNMEEDDQPAVTVQQTALDNDAEVEILGVVHDSETGFNYGGMVVDDQEIVLIDVDGGGDFECAVADLNGDGYLSENEIVDISGEHIGVNEFAEAAYASNDGTIDYIDDTPDYDMA